MSERTIHHYEQLDAAIRAAGGKPQVLEALWDGDTEGWYLLLYLHTTTGFLVKRPHRSYLGRVRADQQDQRRTDGRWPEAALATELGERAAAQYGLTFYFPAGKEPDDDCPDWHNRHRGIRCADCSKLIIPTDSPYLPKDICYHCHLRRESNEELRQNKPIHPQVLLYLYKDGASEARGSCADFATFRFAPYVDERLLRHLPPDTSSVLSLHAPDLERIERGLRQALEERLAAYEPIDPASPRRPFQHLRTIEYGGRSYELATRFHGPHEEIRNLFRELQTATRALAEGYRYELYFKRGLTCRDETALRFVGYVSRGRAERAAVLRHFYPTLSETDVAATLQKLAALGSLRLDGEQVVLTPHGAHLIAGSNELLALLSPGPTD